jgi:hypothetical protein
VLVQVPPAQISPLWHVVLQSPQWAALVVRSKHFLPHASVPAVHASLHVPAEQSWPLAQALPQAPQFAASSFTSAHTPPQSFRPPPQVALHVPPEQTSPPVQALPQSPQCAALEATSTQVSPHFTVPPRQSERQLPTEHTWPAAQALPQAPQFARSVSGSTQVLLHESLPGHASTVSPAPPVGVASLPHATMKLAPMSQRAGETNVRVRKKNMVGLGDWRARGRARGSGASPDTVSRQPRGIRRAAASSSGSTEPVNRGKL